MKKLLLTSITSTCLFVMTFAKSANTNLASDLAKDENFTKAVTMFYDFTEKVKRSNSMELLQKISAKTATEAEVGTFVKQIGMANKKEFQLMLAEYNHIWSKIYQKIPGFQLAEDKSAIVKDAILHLSVLKKITFALPPLTCFAQYMTISSGCFTTAAAISLTDEDLGADYLVACLSLASSAYLACVMY